ncbi:MAG TPA: helix-turn-helix domain-containing protein [Rhodoblastus sp.]|nr:helix-turn-helix domain-containing protein [Rhodoblastus sp.]
MAVVRRSLTEIKRQGGGRADMGRLRASTERDIGRHQKEDGEASDASSLDFSLNLARAARAALDMTQEQMATLTNIPVATLRNWEQGRTTPDATARALLTLILRLPAQARRALENAAA